MSYDLIDIQYRREAHETTPVLLLPDRQQSPALSRTGRGQIIGIRQRFIFQPENIQADLVALDQFLIIKGTPATAYPLSPLHLGEGWGEGRCLSPSLSPSFRTPRWNPFLGAMWMYGYACSQAGSISRTHPDSLSSTGLF